MCLAICSILGPQGLLGASRRRSDDAGDDNDADAFTLLFLKGHKKMFGFEFKFGSEFGFKSKFRFEFGF